MKRLQQSFLFTLLILLINSSAFALCFERTSARRDLYGGLKTASVKAGDTIGSIARRYDVGYFQLLEANPQVKPHHLKPGTELIIPTQFILPPVAKKGIVINLGSMRLFYFPPKGGYFCTYPVGIGKKDWASPQGQLRIVEKIRNPVWVVPSSVYKFRKEHGDPVPHSIPPGPDNPLGKFAMRLSKPTFLIHGTNDPGSVGVRSSAGCIHLYPEDIELLFTIVKNHTPVRIIDMPFVAGWKDHQLYVAAHLPLEEDRQKFSDSKKDARHLLASVDPLLLRAVALQPGEIEATIRDHTGIPSLVTDGN